MSSSIALKNLIKLKCLRKLTNFLFWFKLWMFFSGFFSSSYHHYIIITIIIIIIYSFILYIFVMLRACTNQMKEWWKLTGERENKSSSAQHNLFLPVNSTQGRNPSFGLWVGKRDQCLLVWVWRVRGLSYSKEVFWALQWVWAAEGVGWGWGGIHINAVEFHHPCLFRWFFSRWRGGSNGHINNKLSINVTGVELLLWIAG